MLLNVAFTDVVLVILVVICCLLYRYYGLGFK